MRGLLLIGILMLIVAACGGGSIPKTPEEALENRARGFYGAFSDGNWLRAHKYLSPRSRELCSSGQFALTMGAAATLLKSFMGGDENTDLSFELTGVAVDGDVGAVDGTLRLGGEIVDLGEEDAEESWIFLDGEWWAEDSDWEEGCDLG